MSPTNAQIDVAGQTQLTATVRNNAGDIVSQSPSWSSSAQGVATVNANGLVTGVSEGQATITASLSGRSGQATVGVNDPNPPAAPSNLQAEAVSDEAIVLTWDDNSNNEDGFVIEREEGAAGAAPPAARVFMEVGEVDENETTFRDEGLNAASSYRYSVSACNDNGCMGGPGDPETETEDVQTHEELVLETEALPGGTLDQPYEQSLQASGGSGEHAWSLTAGPLPTGLTLSPDGAIAGTPTAEGIFTFTVEVASGEQTESREFTIDVVEEILPPVVTTTELPDGLVGAAYAATLEASLGDGSYAWAVTAGAPPGGLVVGADGKITGMPTAAGDFDFTVEVTSAELTGTADLPSPYTTCWKSRRRRCPTARSRSRTSRRCRPWAGTTSTPGASSWRLRPAGRPSPQTGCSRTAWSWRPMAPSQARPPQRASSTSPSR